MLFLTQTAKAFIALFIITDSLGNLPFFIGLTDSMSIPERRKTVATAVATGLVLLAVFGIAGAFIFDLFEVTIDDMKIAGGILLFFISLEVLIKGKVSFEHKEDIGIVPLGCPLLVGPGAITTFLVLLNIYNLYAVLLGTVICFVFIWLILHFAEDLYRLLGRNGSLIVTKIAGILVAAIAIKFIRQGIQAIFHI